MKTIKFSHVIWVFGILFFQACTNDLIQDEKLNSADFLKVEQASESKCPNGQKWIVDKEAYLNCDNATNETIELIKPGKKKVVGGTLTITADGEHLYVTFKANPGDLLSSTSVLIKPSIEELNAVLWAGGGQGGFSNGTMKAQNPQTPNAPEYKYVFDIADYPAGSYVIAALAEINDSGNFWAAGTEVGESGESGNNGSYASFTASYCVWVEEVGHCEEITTDEGCGLSQGYWFSKPQTVWPGDIKVAGQTYTQAEGKAIWDAGNNGITSKHVFLQIATAKLNDLDMRTTKNASVWTDVITAEAWLESFMKEQKQPKLSPQNLPEPDKKNKVAQAAANEAKAAAGRISSWIDAHHCNEQIENGN